MNGEPPDTGADGPARRVSSRARSDTMSHGPATAGAPASPAGETQLEMYWRAIVASEGRIATCALYQRSDATLELRVSYARAQAIWAADVGDADEARALAVSWFVTARTSEGFAAQPPSPYPTAR